MNPERWDQIKELVNRCLESEPDKRTAILDDCCGEDAELRKEVESLLASFEEAGEGFLENPAIDTAGESLTGQTIGLYEVGEKIAEGGMGAVYRAVRQSDFRKRVAIKVVKRGMDSDFILSRFRQERQILAGLDHPNVARLLDGGVTNEGRPYLVMEYVEGTRITDYCDERRLDERARLEMARTVCSAVQYAHQNLVVHRDLKPANILVTADGEPKLLDFGIAKLLEPDAGATSTLLRMLSPECASPEQVRGEAITTATDIYSIGVLLYRLLTGEAPYRFDDRSPAQVARVICDQDPTRPGEIKRMHADLDNIVLKAMHKDPTRRYASAEQLSEDIRRYLEGLPVIARKDTLGYRASKFVARHRGATIAASLAVLSLMVGIATTLWQAHRSHVQEQIAKAVNDFLRNDVLAQASANKQAGPGTKPDPDLKVRTALDRAATRIDGEFKGQPLIEASIRQTMAEAYNDLGLYPEAERHGERAVELRRNVLGEKNADTLASMETLAQLYGLQSRYADDLNLQLEILNLRKHVLGERDPETLATMDGAAAAYRHLGKLRDAEAMEEQVLDGLRKRYGEEKPETLIAMNDMATIYEDEGKYPQAEELYFRSNAIRHRVLGDEHPDTLSGMNNLASVYSHEGKYDKAEQIQSQVLEARRRILGPEHPDTLTSMNNLAVEYTRDGKYALAEPLLAAVMETRRKLLGEDNPSTLLVTMNLASVYARQGKLSEAESLNHKALETETRVLGPDNPLTLTCEFNLGAVYQQEGRYAQAEPLFSRVLTARIRVLGSNHPDTLRTMRFLARDLIDENKYTDAEPRARAAMAAFETKNPDGWERFYTECLAGESLAGEKKYAEAEPLLTQGYQGIVKRAASIPSWEQSSVNRCGEWAGQLSKDWSGPQKSAERRNRIQARQ